MQHRLHFFTTMNTIKELTGASYGVITRLLSCDKRILNESTYIKRLERSLPSIHWDLNISHISALLYGASKFPSKAGPVCRSLCVRLSNICDSVSSKDHISGPWRSPMVDINNLVVIAWSLERFARRDADDIHIRKASFSVIPSLLHWVEDLRKALSNDEKLLEYVIPHKTFTRLCTTLSCLDNILEGPNNTGTIESTSPESQKIYASFYSLIIDIFAKMNNRIEELSELPPSIRLDTRFEEIMEAYLVGSLNVLSTLIRRGLDAKDAIEGYWKLLGAIKITSIKNVDPLVKTVGLLCEGKIPFDRNDPLPMKLLDEIGKRNLETVPNEQLLYLIKGCVMMSVQHAGVLEATSEALVQRSHCLPGVPWTITALESFKTLSYHNPAVLELLVRHIHNNLNCATNEQIEVVLNCFRALNYNNTEMEELLRPTT